MIGTKLLHLMMNANTMNSEHIIQEISSIMSSEQIIDVHNMLLSMVPNIIIGR